MEFILPLRVLWQLSQVADLVWPQLQCLADIVTDEFINSPISKERLADNVLFFKVRTA